MQKNGSINLVPPLRILVSGSSGLVGKALVPFLRAAGHEVVPLVRNKDARGIYWDPARGEVNIEDFEGFDALILLAGKSIASSRWTKQIKEEIFLSRTRDNWFLSHVLLRLTKPPKTVICASAIGFYGDRGEEILTEDSPPGTGFLADVCQKWEQSTESIEAQGIRGVHTRFGVILSQKGGMLRKMIPVFRLGLGAVLGSGNQFISWVALEDVVHALYHILITPELNGPVNVTAPLPETNRALSSKLAKALHRPLLLKIPESLLKVVFGKEMAEEIFLSSTKAIPQKLEASGYRFLFPTLEEYFVDTL